MILIKVIKHRSKGPRRLSHHLLGLLLADNPCSISNLRFTNDRLPTITQTVSGLGNSYRVAWFSTGRCSLPTDTPSAGSIVCFSVLAFKNKSSYDCLTIVIIKSMKIQKIQEQLKRIRMMLF